MLYRERSYCKAAAVNNNERSKAARIEVRTKKIFKGKREKQEQQISDAGEVPRKRRTGPRLASNSRAILHHVLPCSVEAWAGMDGNIGDVTSEAGYGCVTTTRVASVLRRPIPEGEQ